MADVKFEVKNRMTISQLKQKNTPAGVSELSAIKCYKSKKGTCFFTVGDMTGYVSPKAAEKLMKGNYEADDFAFAEFKMEGKDNWVPTITLAAALEFASL